MRLHAFIAMSDFGIGWRQIFLLKNMFAGLLPVFTWTLLKERGTFVNVAEFARRDGRGDIYSVALNEN